MDSTSTADTVDMVIPDTTSDGDTVPEGEDDSTSTTVDATRVMNKGDDEGTMISTI